VLARGYDLRREPDCRRGDSRAAPVKTIVLVLGTHAPPFPALIETIKSTWASVPVEDVDVLFYYGGDQLALRGRDLYLPVADDLPSVGRKTLSCFEYLLESVEFDLVFRTNCSTYVDLPNLRRYIEDHAEPARFYAGKGGLVDEIDFATGTGFFLSRDLVELVVEKQAAWDHSYLDDVALAKLLHAHGVERRFAPRVVYQTPRDARKVDVSQFHFRCKTAPTGSTSRSDDTELMVKVHEAFRKARTKPSAGSRSVTSRVVSLAARILGRGALS
jgi:hypothetical protein